MPEDFHRFYLKCTADITADISKRWGDNNYLNKVENEFLILLGFFTPNIMGYDMEAIEKCLRFCGNFDGRGKKEKKIIFFKEREKKKQFEIHTCNTKGSIIFFLSQRHDVAIEIFYGIVCTDQNCTCIIIAQVY